MISLRKQLLCWLLPLYIVAARSSRPRRRTSCTAGMDLLHGQPAARVRGVARSSGRDQAPRCRTLSGHNVQKGDLIVQMWDRDGRLLATSWPDRDLPLQKTRASMTSMSAVCNWRVYTLHSPDRTVQSVQMRGFPRDGDPRAGARLGLPYLLLIPLSIAILWFGIRMSLRRLERVARAADAQDERNFCELPIEHAPCEIHPLVLSVNKLLGRLRNAFSSQRRFVQDAAHELRTPITAMTLQLENLKARVTDPAARSRSLSSKPGSRARSGWSSSCCGWRDRRRRARRAAVAVSHLDDLLKRPWPASCRSRIAAASISASRPASAREQCAQPRRAAQPVPQPDRQRAALHARRRHRRRRAAQRWRRRDRRDRRQRSGHSRRNCCRASSIAFSASKARTAKAAASVWRSRSNAAERNEVDARARESHRTHRTHRTRTLRQSAALEEAPVPPTAVGWGRIAANEA